MGSAGGGWVGGGHSKEFIDLVKSIGEARSQAEEDRIVIHEIETLKRRITDPEIPKRKMKEYILRLVYVEMLGHNASFGYIHAVKMAHDDSISLKRTGYLAVALFLNEDHDLIILIVNTIQKDLKSDNYLVVCAALGAVCKLINEETIPAVLPQVVQLIGHAKEAVRKKAIMALHRCYQRSPSSVDHLLSNFRKRLCDNDPGVMGATLCPLFDLISRDVNAYKDLVISFVSILKQVAERRLPKSYDYHQMPAPFIQIKLLKILALLGSGDKQASEHMYTVIGEIFRKSDQASNIGNAILYECICCVSSIYPNTKLLEPAVDVISRFLKSDVHNLKYLGIDAISRLIKLSPEFAEIHQLAVIDCLEDPDDTLKRKTFELLYRMTKPSNVEVIVENMIDYMIKISDNHYKTEIASRCVELAEQFAPTNNWFIQTMNKVFEHAGDLVNIKVAHNLMRLIAEGFEGDDSAIDTQLRSSAVESYLHIIGEPKLPSAFLQIICWVLGEYGTADGKYSTSYISGKLCDVAEAHSNDDTVKAYAVTAIMKIYAFEIANGNTVEMLPECESFIEDLTASHSTDLQQRAYELQALAALDAHAVSIIMPLDSSCVDLEIDNSLPFLDSFVQKSLEKGAKMYIPESDRLGVLQDVKFIGTDRDNSETFTHSLRFEAYDLPNPSFPPPKPPTSALSPSPEIFPPASEPSSPLEVSPETLSSFPHPKGEQPSEPRLRLDGVNRKWGRPVQPPAPSGPDPVDSQSSEKDAETSARSGKPRRSTTSGVEISSEKKKLAASLFGGPAKSERSGSRGGGKAVPPKTDHGSDIGNPSRPPPDLLDFGSPENEDGLQPMDPFQQLEGLIGPLTEGTGANLEPLTAYVLDPPKEHGLGIVEKKGTDTKEVLERDALVRRMGVTPVNQNPNLFKDLLS